MRLNLNKKISNKLSYTIISLVAVILFGVLVWAQSGGTPNPGHPITEVGSPVGCDPNEFLQWDGTGWICANAGGGGGGGVGGSGTAGFLARWTGANTLGNSAVSQVGDNIAFGGFIYTRNNTQFGAQVSGHGNGIGVFGSNLYVDEDGNYKTFGGHGTYGYSGIGARWGQLEFYTKSGNTNPGDIVTPPIRMVIRPNGDVIDTVGHFANGMIYCSGGITFNQNNFVCNQPRVSHTLTSSTSFRQNYPVCDSGELSNARVPICLSLGGHYSSANSGAPDVCSSFDHNANSWVVGGNLPAVDSITCNYLS